MKKYLLMILSLLFVFFGCQKYEKGQVTITAPNDKNINTSMQILNVEGYQKVMQEHKGKVVLLNFFGSWCPPCKAETPDFVQIYEKYKDNNNFIIIGLAVDQNQADALKFANDYGITYPVYQADRSLINYFGINPIPTSIVFDKEGNLLDSMVGYMSKDVVEQIAKFGEQ